MIKYLTELIRAGSDEWLKKEYDGETDKLLSEYLAEHLLAAGVIVPPVKVGQTLYAALSPLFSDDPVHGEVCEWEAKGIAYEDDGKWWIESEDDEWYELGEDLCKLTREEAEQVLKGYTETDGE